MGTRQKQLKLALKRSESSLIEGCERHPNEEMLYRESVATDSVALYREYNRPWDKEIATTSSV